MERTVVTTIAIRTIITITAVTILFLFDFLYILLSIPPGSRNPAVNCIYPVNHSGCLAPGHAVNFDFRLYSMINNQMIQVSFLRGSNLSLLFHTKLQSPRPKQLRKLTAILLLQQKKQLRSCRRVLLRPMLPLSRNPEKDA